MENEDYIYVNGHGDYGGNILLDPDGSPTRAEMYNAIAEVSHPLTITERVNPWEIGFCAAICLALAIIALLLNGIRRRLSWPLDKGSQRKEDK